MKTKNLHLIISIFTITLVGVVYGLIPNGFLKNIFQFKFENTDLSTIFRAMMGLYIGMATFWLIGIVKPQFWVAATLSNILFMGGLAMGRILSIILDGTPSCVFLLGLTIEFLFSIWGIINLKKYKF